MATINASGYYFIDGKDLWNIFSMFVEYGTDDFLKYPAMKESITHDWMDSNGIDIDTSHPFFNERQISLRIGMIVNDSNDFWDKYNAFIAQMMLPGLRRIEPKKKLGERSFFCKYKECSSFTSFTKLRDTDKIGIKFTVTFIEPSPSLENNNVFIVDEAGRFLIT